MKVRELLLVFGLFSVIVSAQYGYGDRFAVDGFDNTVGGDSSGCPDFGPMESFNAEGLQRLMMLMQGSHWLNNANKEDEERDSGECVQTVNSLWKGFQSFLEISF